MLLIYSAEITNRLEYIFELIFTHLYGIKIQYTSDIIAFQNHPGPLLNYSQTHLPGIPFFFATPLLFENSIRSVEVTYKNSDEVVKLFLHANHKSLTDYDPFAASFYLVSRYEEYLPFQPDPFGNFEADQSIAYKLKFIHRPVVNIWAGKMVAILHEQYPSLEINQPAFDFISTFDVDVAFAYIHKGALRNLGGLLKKLSGFRFREFSDRLLTLAGKKKDIYDTYDWIREDIQKHQYKNIFFFNMGDHAAYDKNPAYTNPAFQKVITGVASFAKTGIHPSFASNTSGDKLKEEIKRLSEIIQKKIVYSRQHYLKLELPVTYLKLIEQGIEEDYTMGYNTCPGFRAGVCSPFYFYDLVKEEKTNLKLYPVTYMEGTLNQELLQSPGEAITTIHALFDEVVAVKGCFISIWHNSTISETGIWKGWRKVYEEMIRMWETEFNAQQPAE
jgi:hypothetical protein